MIKAGLDDKGNLVGWHHRIVAENVDAVAAPPRFKATGGKDIIGWRGMEQEYYTIPNIKAERCASMRGMRVHAWRGIGAGYNKFAASPSWTRSRTHRQRSARHAPRADQGASACPGGDQGGGRDGGLEESARGRALGIAFSDYHETFTAGIAEVSVDPRQGKIKVHNYWIAVDPGIVIQPENAHAQLESAVVYGLGGALSEELTSRMALCSRPISTTTR